VRFGGIRAGDAALLAIVVAIVLVVGAFVVAREAGASERRSADRRLAAVTEAAAGGFVDAVDAKYLEDEKLKKVVEEENADRRELYKLIAEK
jgi:uncharacterized protein YdbL (DUF1318 family)